MQLFVIWTIAGTTEGDGTDGDQALGRAESDRDYSGPFRWVVQECEGGLTRASHLAKQENLVSGARTMLMYKRKT
jgi:hypothetical protein